MSALDNIEGFFKTQTTTRPANEDDEDDLFCRCITAKIKKIPLAKKNDAKIKILQFLNNIEMA